MCGQPHRFRPRVTGRFSPQGLQVIVINPYNDILEIGHQMSPFHTASGYETLVRIAENKLTLHRLFGGSLRYEISKLTETLVGYVTAQRLR